TIGRRIVEDEQGGAKRAAYGEAVLARLSEDLTRRFKRGFSVDRLETARLFYLTYPTAISATPSRKSRRPGKSATLSRISVSPEPTIAFPLTWSHYVLLIRRLRSATAREFYEAECLRGG